MMSYQLNPNISFGLGFNALNISDTQLSNQIPKDGPLFTVIENGKSWAYGWNAGTNVLDFQLSLTTLCSGHIQNKMGSLKPGHGSQRSISRQRLFKNH